MADDKKGNKLGDKRGKGEGKSDKPSGGGWHPLEVVIILFLIISVLGTLGAGVASMWKSEGLSFYGIPLSSFRSLFYFSLPFLKIFSFILSVGFVVGIVILSRLKGAVLMEYRKTLVPKNIPASTATTLEDNDPVRLRWTQIMEHLHSEHPSSWRLAIIEADILLGELLDQLHLYGETIGEKLKAVEKSDFQTIDMAWEAHKVRNMIAHDGADFQLNGREAQRIISLYESVFREFHMI